MTMSILRRNYNGIRILSFGRKFRIFLLYTLKNRQEYPFTDLIDGLNNQGQKFVLIIVQQLYLYIIVKKMYFLLHYYRKKLVCTNFVNIFLAIHNALIVLVRSCVTMWALNTGTGEMFFSATWRREGGDREG